MRTALADECDVIYCVVSIRRNVIAYLGDSLHGAAWALVPGMCFGKGLTADEASTNAYSIAQVLLAKAKLHKNPMYC